MSALLSIEVFAQTLPQMRSADLNSVHESYIREDFNSLLEITTKFLLKSQNSLERENALQLFEKTYTIHHGNLHTPSQPPQLRNIEIYSWRLEDNGNVRHFLELQADVDPYDFVAQVSLIQTDKNLTLLDKNNRVGHWRNVDRGPKPTTRIDLEHNIYLRTEPQPMPFSRGVYALHFKLKDGATYNASFLLTADPISTSPEILSPPAESVVATKNPILRWVDYRSSNVQEFETRRRHLRVMRIPDGRQTLDERSGPVWGAFLSAEDPLTIRVGERYGNRLAFGETGLENGLYAVDLTYYESRNFGSLRLVRASSKRQNFSVKID